MRSVLRFVIVVLLCAACGVATARAADPYAGFGDPVIVGRLPGPVRAVAPLPGGAAAVLSGGRIVGASDTRAPDRVHALGAAWAVALVTWSDGARLAAWTAADGLHVARATPDGTWSAAHAAGDGVPSQAVAAIARPGGDAVVAWTEHPAGSAPGVDRVQVVVVAADGTPGPVEDLGVATTYVGVPALAAGVDGTVALAWPEPTGTGGRPPALRLAVLAPGAMAFGPSQALEGAGILPPSVAVAPDGTTLVATGKRVARLASDGRMLSDLPLPGSNGWAGVGVAPGGTAAVLSASPDGWNWRSLAPDGSLSPAGAPARGLETFGVPQVHVWDDGSATALIRTTVGDNDADYTAFVARTSAGATSGTTLAFGAALDGFAGAASGSFTAFAADQGKLWRFDRPGRPSWRPATLTLVPGMLRPTQRTASFHLASDQVGTATIRVRVRHGSGRWRTVLPADGHNVPLLPLQNTVVRLPLPGRGSPCGGGRPWTVAVSARFRNRAGVLAKTSLTYASGCLRVHRNTG